ncbi:MAG: M48 family metalloprotease [Cyanobacteria bacterium P01_A01_bin.114]
MTPEFDPEQALKKGTRALKRQDYAGAIAIFEEIRRADIPRAYQLKALMGLVRTYEAKQAWQQALAFCQPLTQSSSRQVRDWANTKQLELSRAQQAPASDLSGFQPLEVESPAAVPTANLESVDAPLSSPESSAQLPAQPSVLEDHSQPLDGVETDSDRSAADSSNTRLSTSSLFHYEALNQRLTRESQLPASTPSSPPAVAPPSSPNSAATSVQPDAASALTAPQWRYAGRLKTGRLLGKVKRGRLWFAQAITALLVFGLLRFLLHLSLRSINGYLQMLDRILPLSIRRVRAFDQDQTWPLLIVLIVLGLAAPWLWDWLLRLTADLRPFSTRLLMKSSPEAVKVLRQICLKRNWQFPTLGLLPSEIPLIFSYGWLPRYGRLVVSQGLLDQLEEDEIATLYAYEIGHWRRWDWPLLSLQGLILYGCHWLYWRLAMWGNKQQRLVRFSAGVGATLSYGVFWLLQKAGSWLSRLRTYYCDRAAAEITGNPNGLVRALGKLTLALNHTLETQGYTPPILEQLTLLLPTQIAASPRPTRPLAQYFAWDIVNPFRSWLSCNQSHPPLGDRLQLLTLYARHWQLPPEIDFQSVIDRHSPDKKSKALNRAEWKTLLLQGSPWFGLAIGGFLGFLLWGIGATAAAFQWVFLDWLYQDPSVLKSSLLLGLGVGTLLRINALFPDLDPQLAPATEEVADWAATPDLIPVDSLPVKLSGQLVGRPGIANWLGQELLLKTPQGLFKLHFFSILGPIGNGVKLGARPVQYLNQPVQVLGWFRRGHHLWIDISHLKSSSQALQAQAPLWSAVVLAISLISGLWILVRG